MKKFINCDWGTSNLRLRLVDAENLDIIAEETSGEGIAATYSLWRQNAGSRQREEFYFSVLNEHLKSLLRKAGNSGNIPVVLSGMASSSIGMKELPYKKIPFNLDGSDLAVSTLRFPDCSNDFIVISGVRTDNDVMRGEETKVVGCSSLIKKNDDPILLMPGTHSKHVTVKDEKAISFKSFMTGEFFDLLSCKSILSTSVKKPSGTDEISSNKSVIAGVHAGKTSNLLNAAFMVRTNQLLKNYDEEDNYYYLSGLLVGLELSEYNPGTLVSIVGTPAFISLYENACAALDIRVAGKLDSDLAVIKGQKIILLRVKNNS